MRLDPEKIEVVSDEMVRVLRTKTGPERLRMASEMFSSARRMLIASLRSEHADWDDRQVNEEAARRLSHGAL